jgi:hypothetical protein
MVVRMGAGQVPSKKTAVRLGVGAAIAMARHRTLRRATMQVAEPTAKVGWRVGKVLAARKLRGQIERLDPAARVLSDFWVLYGPIAAEALGLVEPPRRRRRTPVFAAGAATGAAASYLLLRRLRD